MQDNRLPNDYQCDNQLSIFDLFEEQELSYNPLVAVSKIFASAKKQMSLNEWKTFILALTRLSWKDKGKNRNVVVLDKMEVAEKLGIKSDKDHVSSDLKRAIGKLAKNSFIEFEAGSGWINGMFITIVDCSQRKFLTIKFEEYYLPLFQDLGKEKKYITMWAEDLFLMESERSITFYEELRLHSDTRKTNSKIYGIKDLKQMFNIPKDGKGSYMRANGHFDRASFEKRIIDPLCDDMAKCSMINLTTNEDGKLYKKIKSKNGKVLGYEFQWLISSHPRVATAKEVAEINQNPQELKVAKDIMNGKKPQNKNTFNNFNQNKYDFDELEDLLLDN